MEPPQPPQEFVPGGFWLRAGAYMIDGFIAGVPAALVSSAATLAGTHSALASLLGLSVPIAYFTYMPAAHDGRTLGKMAAGLAVIRADGSALTFGRAFGRWVGYYLSSLPLFLGFIAAAFTKEKRALHDYVADTRVVVVQDIGKLRRFVVICCGLLIPLVFILGILAAIAIPNFTRSAQSARESATKGNLGAMRAALSIYYGDQDGFYPETPAVLTRDGRYLTSIPSANTPPHHPQNSQVVLYDGATCDGQEIISTNLQDSGGWGYISAPNSPCHGMLFVDCSHTDSKGSTWNNY
ncbi:MAG: RDD family protein [Elusimicrobiota bacterium]